MGKLNQQLTQRDSKQANPGREQSSSNNPNSRSARRKLSKKQKIIIGVVTAISILAIISSIVIWLLWSRASEREMVFVEAEWSEQNEPIYSRLTGLEIPDEKLNSSPTYCVQIPNGSTDGARPQAGLAQAAVIFEAIAESGITRFAAIFQNANTSAIGPIRSLRPYYLDWDTPFDCTVVHAGGSTEAIKALQIGGQRDLNESYVYMWRENGSGRNWNNLFTSSLLLNEYNLSKGWDSSNPKVFARMTPDSTTELLETRAACTEQATSQNGQAPNSEDSPSDTNAEELTCKEYRPATNIQINFSANYSHNVAYNYDPATNTYLRSHQDGKPHLSYDCPAELANPNTKADCGEPKQIAPSVVIVMRVEQNLMADRYHQSIRTIGNGEALIFQNGEVIEGTWIKNAQDAQIVFKDRNKNEIALSPGQVWISVVPQYGTVKSQ